MLTNVFRRLNLSESEATASALSGDVIKDGLKTSTNPKDPALLNLPMDIVVLFLNYLHTRDLIALSLTTKKLRWICPAIEKPLDDDDDNDGLPDNLKHRLTPKIRSLLQNERRAEARCSHRTHQRFLPPSKVSQDKCPYCAHPLCPPSCSTALFLDTLTGVFYPAQFYRTNKAVFKYSTNLIQKLFSNSHIPSRSVRADGGQKTVYSTIWCEHHRCPRNLFSDPSINLSNPLFGSGAQRFLTEYTETSSGVQWRTACGSKELGHWVHDRWRVGYKPLSESTTASTTGSERPVHEAHFYASLCLHCLHFSSYQRVGSLPTSHEHSCSCGYVGGYKGCVRCGVILIRLTRIEVFDLPKERPPADTRVPRKITIPREGFWLYIATEYKVGRSLNPNAPEPRRLYPKNLQRSEQLLSIVRGFNIIPLPPQPRIRLQDLPYSIIQKIILILNPMDPGRYIRFEDSDYFFLSASYSFIRAVYGQTAPLKSLDYLREPWYLMCSGRKGGFNSTEVFWNGQMDAKVREEQWKATRVAWSMGTGLRSLLNQK
ncbi:hypothetical protein TWF718_000562 [Orbilia javanica]|uniref:F-box domain-containing protein n=1 Tax=Orbilia javanica TaxID=47235 RepID=A0AAN8RGH9_9PEZI